ncbi:hypothetical protein IFR05_005808 [Cadophora sp. M221]|nr:hypothetical protein IFR05_005808 [Cadophora sp. M221]
MAPFTWNKVCTNPTDESPSPFPKFNAFPRLPSELRIKIWKLALPGRRIITIKENGLHPFHEELANPIIPVIPGYSGPRYGASQDAPPPAILFVNAEAREQALKYYSPIFTYVQHKTVNYVCGIQPDLKKVKNLALGPGIQPWFKQLNWYGTFENERENDTRFKHFHNLQTLIMSADQATPFTYEFSDDIQISDLCGVHGQTLHVPPFMCRLPIEDLVSFDEAECQRRWREARVKHEEAKAVEFKVAFDAAVAAAAAL